MSGLHACQHSRSAHSSVLLSHQPLPCLYGWHSLHTSNTSPTQPPLLLQTLTPRHSAWIRIRLDAEHPSPPIRHPAAVTHAAPNCLASSAPERISVSPCIAARPGPLMLTIYPMPRPITRSTQACFLPPLSSAPTAQNQIKPWPRSNKQSSAPSLVLSKHPPAAAFSWGPMMQIP